MVCEPHMALHGSKFNSQLPGKPTPKPFLEIGRKWKWNKRQPACFGSLVQPYILHRTSCLFHKRGRIIKNILSNHNTNWDEIIFKKTATSPLLQLFPTGPFYDCTCPSGHPDIRHSNIYKITAQHACVCHLQKQAERAPYVSMQKMAKARSPFLEWSARYIKKFAFHTNCFQQGAFSITMTVMSDNSFYC